MRQEGSDRKPSKYIGFRANAEDQRNLALALRPGDSVADVLRRALACEAASSRAGQ